MGDEGKGQDTYDPTNCRQPEIADQHDLGCELLPAMPCAELS
jgi:hypothetical protein